MMLASTIPLMLLASALPSLAQITIQTFDTTNPAPSETPSLAPVATTCLGDGCSGTSSTSKCYAVCVHEPCNACFPTLDPSVVLDTTASIHLSSLTTDIMLSIPAGETGSPTPAPSTSSAGGSTSGGSASGGSASGGASSTAPAASQSTGAAPPIGINTGDSRPVFLAIVLSAVSVTLGFAWTLL